MLKDKGLSGYHAPPSEVTHLLNLAEACLQAKRYEETERWLAKVSGDHSLSPRSPEAYRYHYLRGMSFFWLGDALGAAREVRQALEIFRRLHRSLVLPERGELPAFVAENLKKLRRVERTLLEGLESESPGGNKKKEALERRVAEISSSLEQLKPLAKLHQLAGSAALELGRLEEAEEHLERASAGFRLSGDWGALAYTLNKKAQLCHIRGELPQGLQILEEALSFCLKAKDRYLELLLRANLGHWQLLSGIWRPAASSLPQSLAEARKAGDFLRSANTLLFMSALNLLRGRLKESRRALEEAQKIGEEKKLVGISMYSHGYAADLCLAEGRLEEAEEHLKKVLDISQKTSPLGGAAAEAWQKLGEVYAARKEYDRALKAFAIALEHLSKEPVKLVEGAARRGAGICYVRTEQFRPAQKAFKMAFAIFESSGNEWELAKTAVLAAENAAFAGAEIYPKLVWAKEIFKKLEHPAWRRRAQNLLEHYELVGFNAPFRLAHHLAEKEQIAQALAETEGNVSEAARKLGLLRQTLQYKIKQYKIDL